MASCKSSWNGFLRPGSLVDFTLKSKESALQFAQTINTLESICSATANADKVVEVRIDFILPGFPSEPISAYTLNKITEKLSEPQYAYLIDAISKPELGFSK